MLTEAISGGDKAEAMRCAEKLAGLNLPVSVKLCPNAYSQDSIQLKVGVGDAQSDTYIPITIMVTVDMTISELKEKVNNDYGFHPVLQKWVIGKRLAQDIDTLFGHGISKNGDHAFLYIKSAKAANFSREQQRVEKENRRIEGIIENIEVYSLQGRGAGNLEAQRKQVRPDVTVLPPPIPPKTQGWPCPQCTFVNKPTRPGCEICGEGRPGHYKVPETYQPDEQEIHRLQQEELAHMQYQQALEEERRRNFNMLMETDSESLVKNSEEIDCTICYCPVVPGEGATLRECLHSFCRDCLKGTIVNCVDAEVTCPYADATYSCNSKLQDREIRSLLSQEEYEKFLEMRLSIAESRSENSYHCKTPDCVGWCIFEDDVNEFTCDICNETNCLLCKAIHKGMNCKEYQDDIRTRAENDLAAKQTADMLQAMLQNGEAMHCPKCKVIVQKKDGCDWICCLMCKTEICWVTKQARWGPQGAGDTSGGCRCRVNGVPCHPNCQNCH
ncbi:ranBP-type and C3HC4-type zinc finger-containing protein 1 [Chanos chanos]|uniref:RanBP-type and C3HC4-type zinc finger-containing protein 1 n=1 Tax=Chanos chanos TaxID=29144 RepID=A0A6J2VNW7_CHACN|nr:ranBP-type and C3HC4-type zinc finger-containing protein 1 [Chanos chanos]